MAGRADIEVYDRYTLPNTYLFNGGNNWETAQVQYTDGKWNGLNRYSTVADSSKYQALNALVEFSRVIAPYAEAKGKAVGIICNARGDTSIEQWSKGYEGGSREDYDLYEKAVERAKAAMEYGNLKAILWHQGCANTTTSDYMAKLEKLFSDLRTDLGVDVPIIIGEIPGYGADRSASTRRINFNINNIQKADTLYNCSWISSAGNKDKGDNTHFDSESQRKMGRKYAQAVLEKVYGITSNKAAFTPDTATCGEADASLLYDGIKSIGELRYGETTLDGGIIAAFDAVSTDGIRIDFLGARNYDGSLMYKDDLTIDCHEIVICGKTAPLTFINTISGNTLTSNAVISGTDSPFLLLAGFKDNGLLVRTSIFSGNAAQISTDGVDKIKIFAWNDLNSLTPASECYEKEISQIQAAE